MISIYMYFCWDSIMHPLRNIKLWSPPWSPHCSSDNQLKKVSTSLMKESFPPENYVKHSTVNTLYISVPGSFCRSCPLTPPPAAKGAIYVLRSKNRFWETRRRACIYLTAEVKGKFLCVDTVSFLCGFMYVFGPPWYSKTFLSFSTRSSL